MANNKDFVVKNDLTINGTGAVKLSSGNTSERPASPTNGMLRYNNETTQLEQYSNNAWSALSASSPGISDSADAFAIYITVNEDVGIGQAAPAYDLDVLGDIRATGEIYSDSDRSLKDNIVPIENALGLLKSIDGVYFNWVSDEEKTRHVGLIAQDVEQSLPELVSSDGEKKSVSYPHMVSVLIQAVKELQQQIDELKGEK